MSKELWLQNNTGADVSLSDLGVKVPANKTINVYKYNPYVTTEQVQKSREDGALSKRLTSNTLTVVSGAKDPRPHTLDHVKASNSIVEVVKSKSAVFIDTKSEDVLEDEDLGDFADYGLGDLGHKNTTATKVNKGVVVIEQKQDDLVEENFTATVKPEVHSGISGQSIVAMTQQVESQVDPVGPIAEGQAAQGSPYVVVKPPDSTEEGVPQVTMDAVKRAEERLKSMNKPKKIGDMVVVDGTMADDRDSDKVIKKGSKTYDAQVATKNESGAIVMKLKEVSEESEEATTQKATPIKVTKSNKKASKKTSKKKTS